MEDKIGAYLSLIRSSKDKVGTFRKVPLKLKGFVLLDLNKRFREKILNKLKNKELIKIIYSLDPDEVTDLLQSLSKHRQRKILEELSDEIREKVEFLLKFDPRTAAGLMSLDYILVKSSLSFGELSKIIQKHEKRTGKFPCILVMEDGNFVGELPGHVLVLHKGKEKIKKYIKRVPVIYYDEDEVKVIKLFKKYKHDKIIVLDKDDVLGVIYSDDILKIIQNKQLENLYGFAGVSREEDALDPAWVKIKHRYKWLIINLATAFLAASVVGLFQDTISKFVLLAAYMPVVAGMGGNAATQTLAVIVRGLTLKEINSKTAKKILFNEIIAATANGLINGVIVAFVALAWNQSPLLGLVVALALVANLIIASFFGTLIPLIMKRLRKDPASSATIFITTATDVFGFLIFLGLAKLILV